VPTNLSGSLTDQNGNPLANQTVSFAVDGAPAGTSVTDATGTASFTPAGLLSAGTHTVSLSFGGTQYGPAAATSTVTVAKAGQTISLGALDDVTFGAPDFDAVATATSGLPVSFGVSGTCTISGATVHITGAGSCTVTASQPGNANYNAAPDASDTFAIARAPQSISFGALGDQTFGDADFEIEATASSGLPVSLAATGPCTLSSATSPATVHISGSGVCTITASQPGDSNWEPAADEERSFSIAKANQTIAFGPLAGKTFGDADFAVSATATSTLEVVFASSGTCTVAGATVHILHAGSCTIRASQPGDADWNPAPDVDRSFAIARQATTTMYTGGTDPVLNGQTATLSGVLNGTSGAPLGGKTLLLAFGTQSCLATTNVTGSGSCSLTVLQSAGSKPLSAAFAGDIDYLPSLGTAGGSVFTAQSLALDVNARLAALLPGASKQDADKLAEAIDKLGDALASSLWIDGNHVATQHGEKVFNGLSGAAHAIGGLKKNSAVPDAAQDELIDTLLAAAHIVAATAIADGTASHADAKKLADAQDKLAQADGELDRNNVDPAFNHYKEAWKQAAGAARH
jgi:hypothetical protein